MKLKLRRLRSRSHPSCLWQVGCTLPFRCSCLLGWSSRGCCASAVVRPCIIRYPCGSFYALLDFDIILLWLCVSATVPGTDTEAQMVSRNGGPHNNHVWNLF